MRAATICLGVCLICPAIACAGLVNVSAGFHPGPYTALYVDPVRPERVLIGTADGHVLESADGGANASEARASTPRIYQVQPLRGAEPKRSLRVGKADERYADPRFFLWQIDQDLPPGRWQTWMSSDDRTSEITALATPSVRRGGRVVAAGAMGVLVSDELHGAFSRALGSNRARGALLTGMSVAFDPKNRLEVLAGTSEGLRVSHNGGLSFIEHEDAELATTQVKQLIWPADDPQRVLALTAEGVLESRDRGHTFTSIHKTEDEASILGVNGDHIWLGSGDGLAIKDLRATDPDAEPKTRLDGQEIVAVLPLEGGRALAATAHLLYELDEEGEVVLLRTTSGDPIIAIAGTDRMAWVLTRYGVFRTGRTAPRVAEAVPMPPKMTLSLEKVQNEVVRHLGIGKPEDTRLANRWYAKLLPTVTVRIKGILSHDNSITHDATFPIGFRYASSTVADQFPGGAFGDTSGAVVVMAHWDLAAIIAGIANASSPYGWIEQGLRPIKGQVLEQVRWRYRESARLAALLARPPADPLERLNWQLRLEENAAYLQCMSGREVVALKRMEEP
jgi:hypothetical protein